MMPLVSAMSAFFVTLAIGYLVIVAASAVAGALARGGRRERALDAYEALAVSRFTIPVSLIVPVTGDASSLSRCIRSLLAVNYPEFEVIVVAESLDDETVDHLKREWALKPKEFFYRRTLNTAAVHRIFDSADDPRLIVVEKAGAGRADALNCGVSLARFRYVVSVSPDVQCDADALLRLMAPALRDPATVLAVTSYVERRSLRASDTNIEGSGLEWTRASDDYQRLASIRSWMATRLAWHQLRCGLPPREGVVAWRRDAVLELDGFSRTATDPELDLLVRLQTGHAERDGRVVRTSEVFGHASAMTIAQHAAMTNRRQRAVFEALRTFWRSPQAASRLTLMFVLGIELMTPLAQSIVLIVALGAPLAGTVSWNPPLLAMLMLTFGYGLVSASALLLRGGAPGAPAGSELTRLLLRAPLEFAVYRPVLTLRRIR